MVEAKEAPKIDHISCYLLVDLFIGSFVVPHLSLHAFVVFVLLVHLLPHSLHLLLLVYKLLGQLLRHLFLLDEGLGNLVGGAHLLHHFSLLLSFLGFRAHIAVDILIFLVRTDTTLALGLFGLGYLRCITEERNVLASETHPRNGYVDLLWCFLPLLL